MKPIASTVLLFVCLFATWPAAAADHPQVVDVWPGKPAGDIGIPGAERESLAPGREPSKLITNVSRPTLTFFRPAKDKDNGAAVLICPGGGYHTLYWEVEGTEVAEWLNSIGVTGIILKYRTPRRSGESTREPAPGPLKDAQRAVSLMRSKAKDWGIDPKRIGMIGFSAGAHLTGATATNFAKRTYEPIDEVDNVSCRPDFGILAYPDWLKLRDKDEISPGLPVSAETPPLFFVHSSDDKVSKVDNSVIMYLALKRAGVPAELHIYATGGHGFGVRSGRPGSLWTQECANWMKNRGFLTPISAE